MASLHSIMNKQIHADLSQFVIGHDLAKKVLINTINRSKLRYYQRWALLKTDEELIPVSNCLLIGGSGTGKTYLMETLSKVMKFPLLKIDATELNPTGASGGIKKKDFINKIADKAKEMIEKEPDTYYSFDGTLSQVVVFVDEVDKLGQQVSSDWNAHVQANFLTLFENKGELADITFVFAGAFTKIDKYTKKSQLLGFTAGKNEKNVNVNLAAEIIKAGLLPELVGRLQNIILLDELKSPEYRNILMEIILPNVKEALRYFEIENYELTEEQIVKLITDAEKSGLGVRSLITDMNKLITDIEFDPDSYIRRI